MQHQVLVNSNSFDMMILSKFGNLWNSREILESLEISVCKISLQSTVPVGLVREFFTCSY